MNEETPTPLETADDASVEARIVAWVLGEASAFEAAELERLCEERPELLIFRRRMRGLHGLLTESEAAEPDLSWQLPAEKRRILDEIFGEEKVIRLAPSQPMPRTRRNGLRVLFAIAACVAISLFVVRLEPWKHEAEVVLELKSHGIGLSPLGDNLEVSQNAQRMTPTFFGTEFEKIKSHQSLSKVVDDLDLASRWKVDREAAIRRVASGLATENARGTDLITIRYRDANEDDAKEIVTEVATAYKDYRSEIESRDAEKGLAELKKAIRDQEDKVEGDRKLLATISKTKGIIYRGLDSYHGQGGVDEDHQARASLDTYNQLKKEKMQLETQINSLQKIDSDQLMVTAAGLDLPDNVMRSIYPDYLQAKLALNKLKSAGEGDNHPDVLAVKDQISSMKNQMEEGVVTLKETLKTKLAIAEDNLKSVEAAKEETREDAIARGLAGQDYDGAKRELESSQRMLESMKLKKIGVETALRMSGESIVIHEAPQLASNSKVSASGNFKIEVAPAKARESGLNQAVKQHQLAKQSASQPAAGSALADSDLAALPEIAEASEMKSIAKNSDSFTDSAGAGLAFQKSQDGQPRSRVVPADKSESASAADSFAPDELAKLGRDKKAEYASAPPVLGAKQPASPAAPESASKLSDLAQREVARRQNAAVVESAGKLPVPAPTDPEKEKIDETPPTLTAGVSQEDQAALKRMYGTVDETSGVARETNHPFSESEQGSDIAGELSTEAEVVWPSSPAAPSEAAPSNGTDKDRDIPNKKDLPELMAEISTSGDPYSTFSLNISDASFQLAKSALAKGESPEPASIKPEQFYNAVDYGDPAPAANEPVTATIEQSAHPIIPGRNLVRVALRTGSVGRSAAQSLRLTLLVDQSGSMVRDDRRAAMEHALAQLGTLLTKADMVTVIGFSRTPHLLADGMTGDQASKLGDLINQTASEGGTNLEEAMKLGAQLAVRHQLAGAQNRIVLFTDGAANLGDAKPERLAEQVKSLRQKGISFDIAGIGADGLNDRLLGELARNGNGRYYVVSNENNDSFARQLAGAFRPAAENVKIQVIFNPQRVAKYKLIGFEKDRLKTEDFRNDAVDAAELAADEAGVAIYQVEPLAEGRGEIGEISVRFRDTSSGEMVERAWTIPYDSQATAFDRATPSMQLAGLSMLAAEKLRGGPLGSAIDFKQLSGSTAFVKQFYGNSPRVADMIHVIDALK